MRRHTIIALILGGLGVLGLIGTIASTGSVRSYIEDKYRFVGTRSVPGDADRTRVYASSKPVSVTAADIADARKPADRRTTAAGAFMRYQDDIVAVQPATSGQGSQILVDDEDTGYRHHYAYIGGFWGTYSGPAESFRGGGPGGGK